GGVVVVRLNFFPFARTQVSVSESSLENKFFTNLLLVSWETAGRNWRDTSFFWWSELLLSAADVAADLAKSSMAGKCSGARYSSCLLKKKRSKSFFLTVSRHS
ncbi:unnamed protein product, partial [Ixodes persulcatus]